VERLEEQVRLLARDDVFTTSSESDERGADPLSELEKRVDGMEEELSELAPFVWDWTEHAEAYCLALREAVEDISDVEMGPRIEQERNREN
jgi:hypothetical protein